MRITKLALLALIGGAVSVASADRIADLEKRIAELETANGASLDSSFGGGGGLSWSDKTSIGGYGEMHYNIGIGSDGGTDKVDFHRWVLFINHEFNDKIKLFSEFELEHSLAGEGKEGEVELEQAYIDFNLDDQVDGLSAKVGLFLIPVGILNETHEPDTFYGVERNNVEKNIIPTTWWEGGVGVTKTTDNGFQFDLAVTSSLQLKDSKSTNIRSGRRKVSEYEDPGIAYTGRVRYTGIEGLELATSLQYTPKIGDSTVSNSVTDTDALLYTAHAVYQKGGFQMKALYAGWSLGDDAPNSHQDGFYIEPSYRFSTSIGDVGVFARYADYNYQDKGGFDKDVTELTFGANYWPHERVVLKADINLAEIKANSVTTNDDTVNLGVGYSF